MAKRIIAGILLLFLCSGCGADIPEPEECALCNAFPRHAPCLVDLNTGELYELEIYKPHHTKVAELAPEQDNSYMRFVQFGEIEGVLFGGDSVRLEAPAKLSGIEEGLFCNACRQLLQENKCEGSILADLYDPKTPAIWNIKNGVSFSVRCYYVQIRKSDCAGTLEILISGTL